jgi:predicted O-linked N-acetylglucosamine transferase (SPINDLY family)
MGKFPADNLQVVRKMLDVLQPALFSVGHYLKDEASDAEIDAIASSPWHESLPWVKPHWLGDIGVREKDFLADVAASYARGPSDPKFIRNLVLARLLLVAYRNPVSFSWRDVPAAYLRKFIDFLMEPLPLIYPGDGEQYARHIEKMLENAWNYITAADVPREMRNAMINGCMDGFAGNHLMMTGANLLPIMRLRNRILQFFATDILRSDTAWTPPSRNPDRKIRLGIVCKTMMAGGETWAMLANISALDKSKYEIIVFYFSHDAGYTNDLDYYREFVRTVDKLIWLPVTDFRLIVAEIRKQDIDILWHQSHLGLMECSHAALAFTHKLARAECAMFAMHAATTGNPYFDYFINIEPAFPPKTWENEFSETELNVKGRIIYIPDRWDQQPNIIINRESLNIPSDAIVYFGGAAYGKYNGEFLTVWLTILKNVPNSYLVLYPFNIAWAPTPERIVYFHIRLQEALDRVGVGADRIRIIGNVNGEAIIHMHSWGHIYLDSFPYGGVTSMNDSIRGGLCPVVPVGNSSLENGDANILASYGLQDLVVRSPEEYVERGIRCGTDMAYRESVRARVKQAWETKRGGFWAQLGAAHAALIEHIVEEKFGEGTVRQEQIAVGGR